MNYHKHYRIRRYRGTDIDPKQLVKIQDERVDDLLQQLEKIKDQISLIKVYDDETRELRNQIKEFQSKPVAKVEVKPIVNADASANSISKYFKELLERDVDSLMADGFDHKKDYLEIPLSALYSMYKDWCVNTGHNRMQSSNIVSYIKDGNIDKVVF